MTVQRVLMGLAAGLASLALLCVPAGGGSSANHPGQNTDTAANAAAVLYRLNQPSTYIQGCFDPCQCFTHYVSEVRGTFKLARLPSLSNAIRRWQVSEVNWHVPLGDGIRVTGSGVYSVGTPFAVTVMMHRLELDLVQGNVGTQRFDSGWVPLTNASSPATIDIDVSMNNMVCFDTVFQIDAAPVPASEIRPHTLVNGRFLEGCLDPCDCALAQRGLSGTFNLVNLDSSNTATRRYWAITDATWLIAPASNAPSLGSPNHRITGYGIYTRGPSSNRNSNALSHRMLADLFVGQNTPERYDSGNVPVPPSNTAQFAIDIAIANNGFVCFNRVFDFIARPAVNSQTPGSNAATLAP